MKLPPFVRTTTWTLVACMFAISAVTAFAQDNEFTRPSLKDLKAIGVLVESLEAEAGRNGLTEASLQTDAELKLRLAGISVLNEGERFLAPGSPFLYITVGTLFSSRNSDLVVYTVSVELKQQFMLTRDITIMADDAPLHLSGATWSVGSYGTIRKRNLRDVRETVKDDLDEFINAWLSVNPR